MSNTSMVQIGLFDRGTAVKEAIANAVRVRETFKKKTVGKGKNKKSEFVTNSNGDKVVSSSAIYLPPRKSSKNEDLADITGLEGQALMLFEAEARQQLMESSFAHMAKLVASGNYTYKLAKSSTRGDFTLGLKLVAGKTRILTEEEFMKQAEVLGFTVEKVKPTDAKQIASGETELVVTPKETKAADKAKPVAKKKVAAKPVAIVPPPIPAS